MELVDVVDSKSTARKGMPVRVRPPAPKVGNPNRSAIILIGEGFGFFLYFDYHKFQSEEVISLKQNKSLKQKVWNKINGPKKIEDGVSAISDVFG